MFPVNVLPNTLLLKENISVRCRELGEEDSTGLGRSPGVARISGKGQVRIFGTRTECRHPEPESSANVYPDFSRVSPCAAAYDTLSTSAHGERLNAAHPGRWPTADGRTPPRGLLWGSHDMRTPPRRSSRANPNRLCGTRRSLKLSSESPPCVRRASTAFGPVVCMMTWPPYFSWSARWKFHVQIQSRIVSSSGAPAVLPTAMSRIASTSWRVGSQACSAQNRLPSGPAILASRRRARRLAIRFARSASLASGDSDRSISRTSSDDGSISSARTGTERTVAITAWDGSADFTLSRCRAPTSAATARRA